MESSDPTPRPSLWKLPALIMTAGLAMILLFAHQQEVAARERADDEFEAEAKRMGTELSAAIGARIDDFTAGLDFVSAHEAIDSDALDHFLDRRRHDDTFIPGDLGLTVSAITSDLNALEAEERATGRADFTIFSALPPGDDERVVVTHVEEDVPVMGRTLVGFDVTPFRSVLALAEIDELGRVYARTTTANDLFGGMNSIGALDPSASADYDEALLYLNVRYSTSDESRSGWLTRLESLAVIIGDVVPTLAEHYGLEARLDGSDHPIVNIERRADTIDTEWQTDLHVVGATRFEAVDLAPLRITFRASGSLLDESQGYRNVKLWFGGTLALLFMGLFAAARAHQSRRLVDTGLELELAQTMAHSDALTGLLNRTGLEAAIEDSMIAGTLLFIDIDNFKQVNDDQGHHRGDSVLRLVGEHLRRLVRADDLVCRAGGDEFIVYLHPPLDYGRTTELQRRIIASVESLDPLISCSIGSAVRKQGDSTPLSEMLRNADAEMYAEKRAKVNLRR